MKRLLALLAIALLCGCLFGGEEDNVEVVDVDIKVTRTTQAPATPSTAGAKTTATTARTTTTTTTATTPTTETTATTTATTPTTETTATTATTTTTTITTASTTTVKTTTTSTTIKCSIECYDIKYPSPKNCQVGCCISNNTRCEYFSSPRDGMGCRCR